MTHRPRAALLVAATVLLGACASLRPTPTPLRTLDLTPLPPPDTSPARCLVILLPGRHDSPGDFARADFAELAAQADADFLAVDAHLGYYYKRTVVDRLREDVIGPARSRYDRIWLVGISLGGTGSLLYTIQHPGDVDGILLLAPFLGEEEVIEEVAAAGGLRGWRAPEPLDPSDFQRRLWAWLKNPGGEIPLYLGYGTGDDFARANGLLGRELPPERVFTVPGGHDWKAWRALWEKFLATEALCGR
jgi:pimeloyl-ACP methyl ester carboxylesterase